MTGWEVIATEILGETYSLARFNHAVDIYWEKPHCANRKVCGSVEVSQDQIPEFNKEPALKNYKRFRKLITKKTTEFVYEGRIDGEGFTEFYPLNSIGSSHPSVAYKLSLITGSSDELQLSVLGASNAESLCNSQINGSQKWLINVFLPKIHRWLTVSDPGQPKTIRQTLRLVSLESYSRKYEQLKVKYGNTLCKIWTEKTDPQKYVYEDIAIAAYLLTLWEEEAAAGRGSDIQSFVDIGCGNGLLVFLLCSEGHNGYGMDLRKRKIWDQFGNKNVKLIEKCYVPTDENLFPNVNWLIGNHSDELTPWLPVIAAKSHNNCQFFVIPCCTYDFFGRYERKLSTASRYRAYLQYVHHVGEICGFRMDEDTLKIPSTKRICFVGRRNGKAYADIKDEISTLIETSRPNKKRPAPLDNSDELVEPTTNGLAYEAEPKCPETWTDSFIPRNKVPEVRNCTAVSKPVLTAIVGKVVKKLLETTDNLSYTSPDGIVKFWNKGADCVQLISEEEKAHLKMQFGGMRTLLKNHRNIFQVIGDSVKFRSWVEEPERKMVKIGSSFCWFYQNHPDKCPLGQKCHFSHKEESD